MGRRGRVLRLLPFTAGAVVVLALAASGGSSVGRPGVVTAANRTVEKALTFNTPIQHIIVIYQENHSFDNVLGDLCYQLARCNGWNPADAVPGVVNNQGQPVYLYDAPDIVPKDGHSTADQMHGIADEWLLVGGCSQSGGYHCLSYYAPSQIPALASLATNYVISDATYQPKSIPSFGAHLEFASQTLDGFTGENPHPAPGEPKASGWGCLSYDDAPWQATPTSKVQNEPACVPLQNGTGAYRATPVPYVPTIMDRMETGGYTFRYYSVPWKTTNHNGEVYRICAYFAECLNDPVQYASNVANSQIYTDAANGNLPNFGVLLPWGGDGAESQHNNLSMLAGDNYIGKVVTAIMNGPEWDSTAIFITYDDCGCQFDHVTPPPNGLGLRAPMVIVSPYAKASYTDSTVALDVSSILAFAESDFGLPPLTSLDTNAYDYSNSFNFNQQPQPPKLPPAAKALPPWEIEYLNHLPASVFEDPT